MLICIKWIKERLIFLHIIMKITNQRVTSELLQRGIPTFGTFERRLARLHRFLEIETRNKGQEALISAAHTLLALRYGKTETFDSVNIDTQCLSHALPGHGPRPTSTPSAPTVTTSPQSERPATGTVATRTRSLTTAGAWSTPSSQTRIRRNKTGSTPVSNTAAN